MKLQQLKYLLAIVDNGLNITAAADKLFTSQPGVSKQLKLLEEELGLQLFTRRGKSLGAVTTAGEQVIDRARRLRVVAGPSTGTDHFDVKLLAERGIELLTLTREYDLLDTFTATAECAWGLLLACLRTIPKGLEEVRRGNWAREQLIGRQLSGRTLGVLGVGRLGKMVVEYGKAFRMEVLGCDLKPVSIPGVRQVDFDTLLSESDVISIHIHLDDSTAGLISREAFAKMKDGVVLINTSRGAIIDEEAFLEALESGKVGAAGIDVIHGEWMEDITKHPLVQYTQTHDNLVISPHIGGSTVESIAGARRFMAKKLADYLSTVPGGR